MSRPAWSLQRPASLITRVALACLAGPSLAATAPAPAFTLQRLAPPVSVSGTYSHGTALNKHGDVVGYTASASYPVATTWLGAAGAGPSVAGAVAAVGGSRNGVSALNDAGLMVGGYAGAYGSVAMANSGSGWVQLPWPDARYTCCGQVDDINNAGVAVGSWYPLGRGAPVRWTPNAQGGWTADLLGGGQGGAVAVNDLGQIAGTVLVGSASHAVLWQPDKAMTDLGVLGGPTSASTAADLNDSATVVGWSYSTDNRRQGFVWQRGAMTAVPGFSGWASASPSLSWISNALAINDAGWVVGHALTAGGQTHGFLMRPGEDLLDLNDLVSAADPFFARSDVDPAGADFTIVQADDVNNAGQLLVTATYRHRSANGAISLATSAFVLTPTVSAPVPEPSQWALLAVGGAALLLWRRRGGCTVR